MFGRRSFRLSTLLSLLLTQSSGPAVAFVVPKWHAIISSDSTIAHLHSPPNTKATTSKTSVKRTRKNKAATSSTALFLLLDVPDDFFTVTFPVLGILLSISKSYGRVRMEERAWEQRLEEGRRERLKRDPTLTELDLRRQEAALEWSAYGKPRMQQQQESQQVQQQQQKQRRRVKVLDREAEDDTDNESRPYRMTDEEIRAFELEYGIDYDPYYDDPYTEEELPEGKYSTDKRYGDRIYENGEVFFKDTKSGLFYRQGAKPRNVNFFER